MPVQAGCPSARPLCHLPRHGRPDVQAVGNAGYSASALRDLYVPGERDRFEALTGDWVLHMETATVIDEGDHQTVCLPKSFHLSSRTVVVRQAGEAIVLEPLKSKTWPDGFFNSIHITDPTFSRPDQGALPPVKPL